MGSISEPPPILDLDRLSSVSAADREFERELVELFLADSAAQTERLRRAAERGAWPEAAQAAHRLKGAALNIGAQALAAACSAIPSAAGPEDATPAGQCVEAILRAHADASEALRRHLATTARTRG